MKLLNTPNQAQGTKNWAAVDAHGDLSLRWAHMSFCWFYRVKVQFLSDAV